MKLKVLDCTLRDGGYYVNWDYDDSLVKKYISSVVSAKIDIVEIGFRFLSEDKFMGAFAYSTDSYIQTLNIPKDIDIAVMINASELIRSKDGTSRAVNYLFNEKKKSPVSIVRIAVKKSDIAKCKEISMILNKLGYRVFLNIMQIDSIERHEIYNLSKKIQNWNTIEVLYFADSFGNMNPNSVEEVMLALEKGWSGPIGIHAHDNKDLALSNSIAAAGFGAKFIDATISGMGRGAGNAKTEYLLIELVENKFGNYNYDALFPIALEEFSKLQKQHKWGSNIYYYLSACYGIHPTYIQEMLSDQRYGVDNILSTLNFLKLESASSFSVENLNRASVGKEGNKKGEWSSSKWLNGKNVLILGSGPGTKKYIKSLSDFIRSNNLIVFCLNINDDVPVELVDAYVACHETRILFEVDKYQNISKPIILPISRTPDSVKKKLVDVEVFDFGLQVVENSFTFEDRGCTLNSPLALPYAVAIASAGGSNTIYLAGFDGYESSDLRQIEMNSVLKQYYNHSSSVKLIAITPSTYSVIKSSLFAKNIIN